MIWTLAFWKGAGERAIKTFFQVFVALVATNAGAELVPSIGINQVAWLPVLSVSGLAAIMSIATSLGNATFTAGQNTQPTNSPTPSEQA